MLMVVRFMKNDSDMEIFNRIIAPGFSHGRLLQKESASMLRLGDLIEETEDFRLVWAKNLQKVPFLRGEAWYTAGTFKTEAYIVDNYPEKDWKPEYEIQLIFDYARKYDPKS